jgi:hypothetical protein
MLGQLILRANALGTYQAQNLFLSLFLLHKALLCN